ncbi:MAG: flagellar hook-length control protein FliK [Pseudomonadota bacterium]
MARQEDQQQPSEATQSPQKQNQQSQKTGETDEEVQAETTSQSGDEPAFVAKDISEGASLGASLEALDMKKKTNGAGAATGNASTPATQQQLLLSQTMNSDRALNQATKNDPVGSTGVRQEHLGNEETQGEPKTSVRDGEKNTSSSVLPDAAGKDRSRDYRSLNNGADAPLQPSSNKVTPSLAGQSSGPDGAGAKRKFEASGPRSVEAALEARLSVSDAKAPAKTSNSSHSAMPSAQITGVSGPGGTLAASGIAEVAEFDLQQIDSQDVDVASFKDSRSSSATSAMQLTSRAEVAGFVGRQMAEALQLSKDQPIQVALSPKELGKVKLSIAFGDAGITINVMAERQETLDLMRRNIQDLAREFHGMGYASVDFAFSEGRSGDTGSPDQDRASGPDDEGSQNPEALSLSSDLAKTTEGPVVQLKASEGLDLRL